MLQSLRCYRGCCAPANVAQPPASITMPHMYACTNGACAWSICIGWHPSSMHRQMPQLARKSCNQTRHTSSGGHRHQLSRLPALVVVLLLMLRLPSMHAAMAATTTYHFLMRDNRYEELTALTGVLKISWVVQCMQCMCLLSSQLRHHESFMMHDGQLLLETLIQPPGVRAPYARQPVAVHVPLHICHSTYGSGQHQHQMF